MSASLRDLNRRVDAVVPPEFDIADIVVHGDRRMRHRRAGLAAGAAALVAATIVIAGVGGLSQRSDPAPQPVDDADAVGHIDTHTDIGALAGARLGNRHDAARGRGCRQRRAALCRRLGR